MGEVTFVGQTVTQLRDLIYRAFTREMRYIELSVGVLVREPPQGAAREPGTLLVEGAVSQPLIVAVHDELTLDDIVMLLRLGEALAPDADPDRAIITHANGTSERPIRRRGLPPTAHLAAGDTVRIPRKQDPPPARRGRAAAR